MKFYQRYFDDNYKELITYYPHFYSDVFEMREILKAHGKIADKLEHNIERTYLNSFIDYADEATISKLEKFLLIGLNRERTLEERRRLVKSYFIGFGKVSATMLKEMIYNYSRSNTRIYFEPSDNFKNNTLYIYIYLNHNRKEIYIDDIKQMLKKKIPAHINFDTIFQFTVDGTAKIYTGFRLIGRHKKITRRIKIYGME